jgi:DNA-binding PucR family transcriptional regulator
MIQSLAEHDAKKGSELLSTLERYLDSGCNALKTARQHHLHRNTLGHRLHKVEQICGIDLGDPSVQLNLQVALKFYRLNIASQD